MDIVNAGILLVLGLALLGGVMSLLNVRHSAHVRMMWFAFSVMYVLAMGFLIYAANEKWITSDGNLVQSNVGEWIGKGLHFMLDLGGTLTVILYALGGLLLVYVIAYVPTALFGCASGFGLVSNAVDVSTVFFLKGFASASAIILAAMTCNTYYHWYDVNAAQAIGGIGFAASIFGVGFCILYAQIEKAATIKWITALMPAWLRNVHLKATRHSRHEESLIPEFVSSSQELLFLLARNKIEHKQLRADMLEMIDVLREEALAETTNQEIPHPHPSQDATQREKQMRISALRRKWGIEDESCLSASSNQ